jgi:precorrin-2 methylase
MQDFPAGARRRTRAAGRLVLVGAGVAAVSHMTLEAIGHIKAADIVFYHATNGVAAAHIRELNSNVVDLRQFHEDEKVRKVTYIQMAELMLRQVRLGKNVVGVFHGHPGVLVMAARRALAIAEVQGYETHLLPAVSSIDCLFADLRVDPANYGVQILKAGSVLEGEVPLATAGHVVILQVGFVGDPTFSFSGFKHTQHALFFERLIEKYGKQHEAVYYVASNFPSFEPAIIPRPLAEYLDPQLWAAMGPGTLYLPPLGMTLRAVIAEEALNNGHPYGELEKQAIAGLAGHRVSEGYKLKLASKAVLDVMVELGTDPQAAEMYRQSPRQFLSQRAGLTEAEREALLNRSIKELQKTMQL